MLRVLVYDTNTARRSKICSATREILMDVGLGVCTLARTSTLDGLSSAIWNARSNYFDLIVCHIATCSIEAKALLEFIGSDSPETDLVIIADGPECAANAFVVGASGFCLLDDGPEGFKRVLVPLARRIEEEHRNNTVGLRTDDGVGNVPIRDITFVEASKKGSIIHVSSGTTLLVRMPLGVLNEKIAPKGAFVMAGRSFIVNLDNVRSAGEGTVLFSNGESIVVPVRVRKSIDQAFEDSWQRKHGHDTPYTDYVGKPVAGDGCLAS